ncbi:uncharacterized protein Pyn_33260 [Prunus yedoensis var. nudiflora]|uniref:Protein DMP9 n=1 Tax=Prunus yedoensis var. nudiflora TaxID=2094558 RepID=A0A314ZK34_PRUYE|nr:uncharacterized protein Pyn_33260 [Prunus yedoensis var. nudiflora]
MDQKSDGVGIKIYNNAAYGDPHEDESAKSPKPPSSSSHPLPLVRLNPDHIHGRKRRAVAKGVQKTLSKTSMLANFLPTGTLLTFEMVLPAIYRSDSFRGPDGKLYYGFVTPKGLAVFKPGLPVEVPKDERYKLGLTDFVHAAMSVMVFAAIAFSDRRVTDCLFPGHEKEMDEVMESFPLMVGIVCSGLFLVFPTTRYGIGCAAS